METRSKPAQNSVKTPDLNLDTIYINPKPPTLNSNPFYEDPETCTTESELEGCACLAIVASRIWEALRISESL